MKKTTILIILSLLIPIYANADGVLKPRSLPDGTTVTISEKDSLVSTMLKVQGSTLFIVPREALERANAEKVVSEKLTLELKQCYLDLEIERSKEHKISTLYKVKWVGVGLALAGAFYLGSRVAK